MKVKYNQKQLMALAIYGAITFFISPVLFHNYMKDMKESEMTGFFVGFMVSIFLWEKIGKNLK